MHLVDTNVVSELMRPRPNARVVSWMSAQSAFDISVITLEELTFGLSARPSPRLERWLGTFVQTHCTVREVSPAIAVRAGRLRGQLARSGATRTQADLLIAATAAEHALAVVTRNERDFLGCGVPILNPWTNDGG